MADDREFYRELKLMSADQKADVLKKEGKPGLDAWRGVEAINNFDGRRITLENSSPVSSELLADFLRGRVSVDQLEVKNPKVLKREKIEFLQQLLPLQIRRLI